MLARFPGKRFRPMELDVCLCTHDPRRDILDLALRSLARQTAGPGAFRLVLVDNASTPPLGEGVLAPLRAAGFEAVLTREERPGLTQARLHAIHRTGAPWMLFVDDDNELADDFVAEGLAFIAARPDVGCFGGKLELPETVKPPRWAEPYLPYLGIKDAGDEIITGASREWGKWEPPGAGFWIRRDQLEAYRAQIEDDPRSLRLGRIGKRGLASREDSLMARQGLKLGLLNAYNPRLSLRHHLDPTRFRFPYLLRLMRGYATSHVLLEAVLLEEGAKLETPEQYRGLLRFVQYVASQFNWARKRSLRFGVGLAAYHWSMRSAYLRQRELVPGEDG
jgi:glycosyltransferase involved in cell wall biosynthesis